MNCYKTLPLGLLLLGSTALAHGPQFQITNDASKITTREVLVGDYTPPTAEKSAYVLPAMLIEDLDFGPSWRAVVRGNSANPWGPGLAYGLDATFPTDSTLSLSFLDELQVWDGGAFVSAGATELAALRTSNPNADSLAGNAGISGGTNPTAEATIGATYSANAHASVTYVLLGDGVSPTAAVADGIYQATLQVSSSDPGIAPSDPFSLLVVKGDDAGLGAAIGSLGLDASRVQSLIPEPGTAALVLLAFGATGRRRGALR